MADSKPWWESELEMTIRSTIQAGGQLIRGIPEAVAAYRHNRPIPEEVVQQVPIETYAPPLSEPVPEECPQPQSKRVSPAPRVIAPPPAPPRPLPTGSRRATPPDTMRAVSMDALGAQPAARTYIPSGDKNFQKFPELSTQPFAAKVPDLGEVTLNRIRKTVEDKGLTLEQLLDPDNAFDPKKQR